MMRGALLRPSILLGAANHGCPTQPAERDMRPPTPQMVLRQAHVHRVKLGQVSACSGLCSSSFFF